MSMYQCFVKGERKKYVKGRRRRDGDKGKENVYLSSGEEGQ